MNGQIKITDLESLREEKKRLRMACKESENNLLLKFDELKENYPHFIADAILPFESDTNKSVKDVLDILNSLLFSKFGSVFKGGKSEIWTKFLVQIAQMFTIRGIYNWFGKKKKSEDKE